MDEAIRKVAALGLPGVTLVIAMAATGLTGGAAIVAALAMLGPGGMIGGIILLGVISIVADLLAKIGIEKLLVKIYEQRVENGLSVELLLKEVDGLLISGDLKRKIKEKLQKAN